jgi:flagellar assembly protein FliH
MPERPGSGVAKKKVSRLEFPSIGQPGADAAPDGTAATSSTLPMTESVVEERIAVMERQLTLQEREAAAQIEVARRQAKTESRREWEDELEDRIAAERERVTQVCEDFARERARYFAEVEAEVVKLALAIAARVLHREAKLDPLLLTAAVRVVLEKVADNSTVELRVPAADVERWRDVLAMDSAAKVQLVGDERLGATECVLETSVGRVDLGVSAQLEEIEKGFFDLLKQRPV